MSETVRFWTAALILLFRGLGKNSLDGPVGAKLKYATFGAAQKEGVLAKDQKNKRTG